MARGFLPSRRAVTAVEFALVAPVFLMMAFGIFDMGVMMFLNMSLESATLSAARYGSTGAEPESGSREGVLKKIISDETYGMIAPGDVSIQTFIYPDFELAAKAEWLMDLNGDGAWNEGEPFHDVNGNGVWDGDDGVAGVGGADAVVVYRVTAIYRYRTPFLEAQLGAARLNAAAPVLNEPF